MPIETRSLTITPDVPPATWRADRAVQSLAGASRRRTQGLFDQRCVQLNGQLCQSPWQALQEGDVVSVTFDPEQPYAAQKKPPKYLGFDILYEDQYLIVVDKPAGWLTVPSDKGERNTLVQRVAAYLTKRNRGRPVRVWAVHRLDRGVSGVLVLARDPDTAAALRRDFSDHEPERQYVALVEGHVKAERGEFRSRLAAGPDRRQRSVDPDEPGQDAVTHYRVEQRLAEATLVRVQLETGRRNQIRVHFAEAGHPILGDSLYAPQEENDAPDTPKSPAAASWPHLRLALHAERLAFQHPVTGERHEYEVPLPDEFIDYLS